MNNYVVNRAKEPTTWAGIIQALAGSYIAYFANDMNGVTAGVLVAVSSLVSIFRKERK